ncbi:MAG: hypothetical protein AcusKO_24780 [Acuticoccus sp.]
MGGNCRAAVAQNICWWNACSDGGGIADAGVARIRYGGRRRIVMAGCGSVGRAAARRRRAADRAGLAAGALCGGGQRPRLHGTA